MPSTTPCQTNASPQHELVVSDAEIQAHALRLAKSGRFRVARPLIAEVEQRFPTLERARILVALKALAIRMLDDTPGNVH